MARPDIAIAHEAPELDDPGAGRPGLLGELFVEVFLARGAAYHDDVEEATEEFRELFASFGILSEENDALIRAKSERLAHRRRREAACEQLRLVVSKAS